MQFSSPIDGKVLLVNFAGHIITGDTFIPDSSLAGLAAVLKRKGTPVEVLDFQSPADIGSLLDGESEVANAVWKNWATGEAVSPPLYSQYSQAQHRGLRRLGDKILSRLSDHCLREEISAIGFKLWIGNGLAECLRVAEALRHRFPNLLLLAGGPAIRYAEESFFRRSRAFDYLVYGEGERALVDILEGRGETAPGVIYLKGQQIIKTPGTGEYSLDSLPIGTFDEQTYPGASTFFKVRVIDDSRGCFNKCSFCSHTYFNGVTRKRSPACIAEAMERFQREEGVSYFRLAGSNPPWKFLISLAKEITKRRLQISYSAFASMNNITTAELPLLSASGLRALFFGIESGDPIFLKRIHNKNNISPTHIVEVIQAAMKANIFACLSFIIPSPFETDATRNASFELIQRSFEQDQLGSALILPACLGPGTDWWNRMDHYGFKLREDTCKETYFSDLLDWDSSLLMPRTNLKDLGFTLNGKSCAQLFEESGAFIQRLHDAHLPTNLNDAAYLVALMGGMDGPTYLREITGTLVQCGSRSTSDFVDRVNRHPRLFQENPTQGNRL